MTSLRHIIRSLTAFDIVILALGYAYFMVSDRVPVWFWLVIAVLFLGRWWATGHFTLLTPISLPTAIIVLMIPVTLWASVDWSLSLPKVYGLLLSVAICFSLLNHVQQRLDVWIIATGLVFLTCGFIFLGIFGVNWGAGKLVSIPFVYDRIPWLIQSVPRPFSGGGISPNGIGGVLVFFVPVLMSLIRYPPASDIKPGTGAIQRLLTGRWLRIFTIFVLLAVVGVLLLTQSRGAVLGLLAGALTWLIWRDRRWIIMVGLLGLGLIAVAMTGRLDSLLETLLQIDSVSGDIGRSASGRLELWQRGMYMVQDFSFTGIGVGTFDRIVNLLYPLFLLGPDRTPTHVHNELLQVAVDMGVPVLVAFLALLSGFFFAAWRAYRAIPDIPMRSLIVALAGGMLAHQVFGLTDAFLLGTKPAVVTWIYLGIITGIFMQRQSLAAESPSAVNRLAGPQNAEPSLRARSISLLWALLFWLLFSLLAISLVGDYFLIAAALAICGGLVVGFLCVQAFLGKE